MTWDEIAERHGTDKSLRVGFDGGTGHGYMDHYERLLADRPVNRVLEVGVYEGASLRTWAEIWPDSEIVGVDNEVQWEVTVPWPEKNVTIWIGDATVADDVSLIDGPFDLIVDDSNHLRGVVRGVMDNFAHRVMPGGFYVVEDCRTGWPHRADGMVISTEEASELLVAHGLDVVEVVPSRLSVDGYQAAMVVAQAPE